VSTTRLDVGLGPHKLGSRNLRAALPVIVAFVKQFLLAAKEKGLEDNDVVFACDGGKDLPIGATLALLCLLFAEDGCILGEAAERPNIDKTFIRRRLGWISTSIPDANPSRATLQSVNSFLMERP
jgi:tRNA A64-2'-O-ribosylphosphate transferase